jgi:very-short-patch-repair endonuclease
VEVADGDHDANPRERPRLARAGKAPRPRDPSLSLTAIHRHDPPQRHRSDQAGADAGDLQRTEPEYVVRRARRQAAYLGLHLRNEREATRDRSELERRMLWVCRRYHLPIPEVNVTVGPFTVDFLWRERRLVVETDGWEAHRGRQAFEDDRARDAYLRLRGYEVLRFSWQQVFHDPKSVVAVLRRYLT